MDRTSKRRASVVPEHNWRCILPESCDCNAPVPIYTFRIEVTVDENATTTVGFDYCEKCRERMTEFLHDNYGHYGREGRAPSGT